MGVTMKELTMSYVTTVSYFTMGLTSDADKFETAISLHGGGQVEFMEDVLRLAVALECVYDALADHHDDCTVVWAYDVVEPFGEWVADFMANPEEGGSVPNQSALAYLTPHLRRVFNVRNDASLLIFENIVHQAFRAGLLVG